MRRAWMRNKLAKVKIDLKLLADLRARRGVYSAAQQAQMQEVLGGMNMVWAPLTEVKCRAASAWIREILLPPASSRGVSRRRRSPTCRCRSRRASSARPSTGAADHAADGAGRRRRDGTGRVPMRSSANWARSCATRPRRVAKAAERRAKRMERQIADRLAQNNYEGDGRLHRGLRDLPAAILKGPVYARHKTLEWGDGFKPIVRNDPAPTWGASARSTRIRRLSRARQQGDFIERVRFRRRNCTTSRACQAIRTTRSTTGPCATTNGHLEGWLWTEAERQRLE